MINQFKAHLKHNKTKHLNIILPLHKYSKFKFIMSSSSLAKAHYIANEIEKLAEQLKPSVIRAARIEKEGQKDLDRIEYALGTIGKALILTDYSVDEQKDLDKLEEFRELHGKD